MEKEKAAQRESEQARGAGSGKQNGSSRGKQNGERGAKMDQRALVSRPKKKPPLKEIPEWARGVPLASLERHKARHKYEGRGAPIRAKEVTFHPSAWQTFGRLFVWLGATWKYYWGETKDSFLDLFRRPAPTPVAKTRRSARRLRTILEKLGPTFIKFGQQLSVRADLLPYEFCEELAEMLDNVPAFPVEQAVERIRAVTGKPLSETYAEFDPVPIGAASLAVVYQARLLDGRKVAIKVRRPGIGLLMAADLRALAWLMKLSELVSLERPGSTENIRVELTTMLLEELNFYREARYTELFRRGAKKDKQRYVTAPRVHFKLSSADVLVTEFIDTIFLREILAAIDVKDEEALADMHEKGFRPKEIAKHLFMTLNWETFEHLLFHADPHPGNIAVLPNNKLIFIDFGSCGKFTGRSRRLWRKFYAALAKDDISGMVEVAISMLEPLPPVDTEKLTKELDVLYSDWLYAQRSKKSEWWEKATGVMWMKFVDLARRFEIPMSLNTLRTFRATFLFDTVVYRLWKNLDMDKEYVRYMRRSSKRLRKKLKREVMGRLEKGPKDTDIDSIQGFGQLVRLGVNRVQNLLDTPIHHFGLFINKAAYTATIACKAIGAIVLFYLAIGIGLEIRQIVTGKDDAIHDLIAMVFHDRMYRIVPLAIFLIALRKIIWRVADVDVKNHK